MKQVVIIILVTLITVNVNAKDRVIYEMEEMRPMDWLVSNMFRDPDKAGTVIKRKKRQERQEVWDNKKEYVDLANALPENPYSAGIAQGGEIGVMSLEQYYKSIK